LTKVACERRSAAKTIGSQFIEVNRNLFGDLTSSHDGDSVTQVNSLGDVVSYKDNGTTLFSSNLQQQIV
jgi:hypothetical protein